MAFDASGHPMELGRRFQRASAHALLRRTQRGQPSRMPHLAALVCHSLFDLAIFDAFGELHGRPVFETLGRRIPRHRSRAFSRGDAALCRTTARAIPAPRAGPLARLASRRRPRSDRAGRSDRHGAERRLPRAAARLDSHRWPALPEDQTARHRRGVGLRAASCRSGGSRSRKAWTG